MQQTNTPEVRLDYQSVACKALGSLRRRAVCEYVEAEELLSIGALALVEAAPQEEALAVVIARRAMIDAVRRNERRERGRVEVREGHGADVDGAEVTDGDQWDEVVHGKQNLRPENIHVDLWESLRALPARQYQAVSLTFWGGMSDEAAAAEMGISRQAVDALLKKAKKNLAEGIAIARGGAITNMRGDGTQRTVLSGRKDAA